MTAAVGDAARRLPGMQEIHEILGSCKGRKLSYHNMALQGYSNKLPHSGKFMYVAYNKNPDQSMRVRYNKLPTVQHIW